MTRSRSSWLLALPIVAFACGGSGSGNHGGPGADAGGTNDGGNAGEGGGTNDDGGGTTGDGAIASGSNVASLIVDNGPPGAGGSVDVPFVTLTVCVPGSTTCQTIDHVAVDTGSSGLRIMASVLQSSVALPQTMATTGSPLVECMMFGDGFTWGSVKQADVKIADEIAANIPLQLIGDPAYPTIPTDCSSSGPAENTIATFGANGIIGLNQIVSDCGSYCTTAQVGGYYSCASAATCAAVGVANALQVSNPVAAFAHDNNGLMVQFPSIDAAGAATVTGALVFGIGTASNNGLGGASVLTVDPNANFTTIFNGMTMSTSYIDSGTNALSFNDGTAITPCSSSDASGFYCPASTVSLMAENKGLNGATSTVSFSVANTDTLFATNDTAFDDLGGPGSDNMSFAWGFPFFFGRSVFVALDGATTPGGAGPYVAY
jgi:hypothetical protein